MPQTLPDRLTVKRLGAENLIGKGGLTLKSAAFRDGEALDPCFTADEEDAVAPPLEWTAPPPGSQEMVLVVEDADSDGTDPRCHWLVWGLKPQKGQLLEGEVPPRAGKNAQGNSEWLLPDLPEGGDPHEFVFQLFALDLPLTLMPGATQAELMKQMEGHVTAAALLSATYASEGGADRDLDESGDFGEESWD